jgi:hypothetical protein
MSSSQLHDYVLIFAWTSSLRRLKIEGNSFTPYREMESEKERELPL